MLFNDILPQSYREIAVLPALPESKQECLRSISYKKSLFSSFNPLFKRVDTRTESSMLATRKYTPPSWGLTSPRRKSLAPPLLNLAPNSPPTENLSLGVDPCSLL